MMTAARKNEDYNLGSRKGLKAAFYDMSCYIDTNSNGKTEVSENTPLYACGQELHDGILPHDFIFDTVLAVIERMDDYDFESVEDFHHNGMGHEIVDGLVDIATYKLLEWGKSFMHKCDEAREEFGCENNSIEDQLRQGQYFQIKQIMDALIECAETHYEV